MNDWLWSTLLAVVLAGLSFYAAGRAVFRTRGVEATLAWVFAIVAFPGLGAVAYLLLAEPFVQRTARKKRRSKARYRQEQPPGAGRRTLQPAPPLDESMLHLVEELTGLPATSGNQVELLAEDEQAFARIEAALLAARHYICAEYYIIRSDETGARFLDLLAQRAREGIQVRLLYDALGSWWIDGRRLEKLRQAGGQAVAFLPVNPLRRRWSINLRNHRKLVVVDGQLGFTGGMNVGDEYSGRARRRGAWHFYDSHLALCGPAVRYLEQIFAEDWNFATDETLPLSQRPPAEPHGPSVVGIVPSGPDQEHNASSLLYFAGITAARQRLFLASPYFLPDEPTMRALLSAALRGVDVRVLVPARNDVFLVGLAGRAYFPRLVRSGVRVYQYLPSMLHGKTLVVDGAWGIVGSANVDIRSFRLNFELSALVCDPAFAATLEARFLADLAQSQEVTGQWLQRYGYAMRLVDGLARLLAPLF